LYFPVAELTWSAESKKVRTGRDAVDPIGEAGLSCASMGVAPGELFDGPPSRPSERRLSRN